MLFDVVEAEYLGDYKIKLVFEDGKSGMVDLEASTKQGVFKELSDVNYFKQFYINRDLGTICWPHGQDIAPETLYENIQ